MTLFAPGIVGQARPTAPHASDTDLPPPTAPPMSTDFDGLLDGLSADDFDFDDLDDDSGVGDTSAARPVTPAVERSPSPDPYADEPPAPVPDVIPQFVAFATARGSTIAPPSEGALKRARKILADVETDVEGEPSKRSRSESPAPGPMLPPAPATPAVVCSNNPPHMASPLSSRSTGFQLGSGTAPPPLDPSARARAMALFGETDTAATPVKSTAMLDRLIGAQESTSGFSQGAAPAPSSEARARVLALFDETDAASGSAFQLASGSSAPAVDPQGRARALAMFGENDGSSPATSGFQTGSGRAAAAPNPENLARARALLGEDAAQPGPSTPAPQLSSSFRPPLTGGTPARSVSAAFSAPRPMRSVGGVLPSTPSRLPLQPRTNTFSTPMTSTPVRPKLPSGIQIKTPGVTPRRIGLGSTPSRGGKARKGFVSPFRAPGTVQKVATPSALRAPVIPMKTPEKVFNSVFDLQPPEGRKGMRESFLYPGYYSPLELRGRGLPDEIWTLDLSNAICYQFIGEDASTLGHTQALERLKLEKCTLATAKWVDNHWRLILWKLAGQVAAKPALFDEKWNWFEVICQLKYRYEREFGAAQRPLLRRIQEHDSSPSLPMVLCVADIHRPPPTMNEKDEEVPQRPYLDLTDGWYHIRALTDDSLTRAIRSGKIKVGRKLAISGAKLESGADGAEVLEAYETSHLVLSGNSTHFARWDARLGAQSQPFVAGLSSLTVDGGLVVLMDVVLDRVYPLAYMNGDRGSREAPWNEEEEQERADAWKDKYEAESQRLQEDMRKNLEKIEDLASTLASHAEDINETVTSDAPDSIDSEFDKLLNANPQELMARLRSLPPSRMVHLAQHARGRLQQTAMEERFQLESQLKEICPIREVRDFRVVRFRDARLGLKDPARTGLLNVWEARGLGDALVEGKRYLVSNLIPGRNGDWSKPKPGAMTEVYLHTRRDSRWKVVETKSV